MAEQVMEEIAAELRAALRPLRRRDPPPHRPRRHRRDERRDRRLGAAPARRPRRLQGRDRHAQGDACRSGRRRSTRAARSGSAAARSLGRRAIDPDAAAAWAVPSPTPALRAADPASSLSAWKTREPDAPRAGPERSARLEQPSGSDGRPGGCWSTRRCGASRARWRAARRPSPRPCGPGAAPARRSGPFRGRLPWNARGRSDPGPRSASPRPAWGSGYGGVGLGAVVGSGAARQGA